LSLTEQTDCTQTQKNVQKNVQTARSLTPQQCAGRMVMVRLTGTHLDADDAAFLRDNHIRAVCLFRNNMRDSAQLRQFTRDLRDVMGPTSLIALDQEGGAVVRTTWLPEPPSAMALGAAADPQLCYDIGAAVARGIRSLGFNWNFAPVLDVNNNPDNPVIAERSFGADPLAVSRLALAWMDGSLSEGVACCVKHFPGHGDTNVDSHRALPTVGKTRAQLEALELVPFRLAACHGGMDGGQSPGTPAMMTAHIVYPALDPDHPATLSHAILTGLLRTTWKYTGVVITDSMDMHAISGRYGAANAAIMAVVAGADMVMALGSREDQLATLSALSAAITHRQLDSAAVETSLQRLDQLAQRYPCRESAVVGEMEDAALMALAWQRGLTVYRQPSAPVPGSKVRLVMRQDALSDGVSEPGIEAERLAALLQAVYEVELVTYVDAEQADWADLAGTGQGVAYSVILASTSRRRYGIKARTTWHPDLHLVLWNPFLALDIAAPAVISYGFAEPAIAAVIGWMTGAVTPVGSLPVLGFDLG